VPWAAGGDTDSSRRHGGGGQRLGDQFEVNLVRTLMTDSEPLLFVTRPISAVTLGLALRRWFSRRGSTGVSTFRPAAPPSPTRISDDRVAARCQGPYGR
jgi:hypothetical protein